MPWNFRNLLRGDNKELGSTQKPTKAWKNSISSCKAAVFTISRRYRRDSWGTIRDIRDRIVLHCVLKNSAGGPRIPSLQPCGHPRWSRALLIIPIDSLWACSPNFITPKSSNISHMFNPASSTRNEQIFESFLRTLYTAWRNELRLISNHTK